MPSREELIRIQKRIVRNLKREINELTGADVPPIRQYLREYENEFKHFREISSKASLVRAARRAQIVYLGDFHTLRISQLAAVRFLTDLLVSNRRVVLALEMLQSCHQPAIATFLRGEISEGKLLREINYAQTWGFDWKHYRDILLFARENNIETVGLNTTPQRVKNRLRARDEHAAQIITSITTESPDSLVYVLYGDLHIARGHLPTTVDRMLTERNESRRKVIIYQNNETVYWRLAAVGLEEKVSVAQIDRESFCIFNTTPLVKFHSVLNWSEQLEELPQRLPPGWESEGEELTDYCDFVSEISQTIADFLGIEEPDIENFTVYTSTDLNFLEALAREHNYDASEVREFEQDLLLSKSCFHPKGNIIYLSSLSVNRAAEESTRFLNSICAQHKGKRKNRLDEFYFRVMTEALGFLGSKVFNHKRRAKPTSYYEAVRDRNRGLKLSEKDQVFDSICRCVLEHRKIEEQMMEKAKLPSSQRKLFSLPRAVLLGSCNAIGHILGEGLYYALIDERISKAQLRNLFYVPLEQPNVAANTYRDLITYLERNHRDRKDERSNFDLPPQRFPVLS